MIRGMEALIFHSHFLLYNTHFLQIFNQQVLVFSGIKMDGTAISSGTSVIYNASYFAQHGSKFSDGLTSDSAHESSPGTKHDAFENGFSLLHRPVPGIH